MRSNRAKYLLERAESLRALAQRLEFQPARRQLMQLAFAYYRLADGLHPTGGPVPLQLRLHPAFAPRR